MAGIVPNACQNNNHFQDHGEEPQGQSILCPCGSLIGQRHPIGAQGVPVAVRLQCRAFRVRGREAEYDGHKRGPLAIRGGPSIFTGYRSTPYYRQGNSHDHRSKCLVGSQQRVPARA